MKRIIIIILLLFSINSFAQNTWVKWNGHIFLKQGTDSTYWGDDAVLSSLPTIVSGSSIKTINGNTLLGSGNLVIGGSSAWGSITGTLSDQTDLQTAINARLAANGNGSALTGLTASQVGLGNVTNESKATMFSSPTFTGTVSGITSSMVGLGNVDNTSDANKPVSSATQTALNLKANLASPTFTGTVSGITATMVGLGNVNNTSDANKPISTATQAALDGKQPTGNYATGGGTATGTNTGDNATNTQYSGLAASKQDVLVSGTTIKTINGNTLLGAGDLVISGSGPSRVFLPNDVINNNGVANTLADVTGLSFPVTAGSTYKFKFVIVYSSAATTTGSRWTINGPATTHMSYSSIYPTSATAITNNPALAAYNSPSSSNASSLTTNNRCIIEGEITPSANGTVIARFASEITASAITAVASGRSYVEYQIIN